MFYPLFFELRCFRRLLLLKRKLGLTVEKVKWKLDLVFFVFVMVIIVADI